MIINAKNINKSVKSGKSHRQILSDLDFVVNEGDSIAIKGRSGSGKTTLLNILGGVVLPDSGNLFFNNRNLSQLSMDGLSKYRKNHIGFITQNFNLLEDRNVFENVALPLYANKMSKLDIEKKVKEILKKVKMEKFIYSNIKDLSGGEKQRIAIARAVIKTPDIILADEPTGSLDEVTEHEILTLFYELKKEGITMIIVTHDNNVANTCDIIYELKNGKLNICDKSISCK